MSTKTVCAVITDRIIQALETGTVPWRMPWRKIRPTSLATGANYRGINRFMLELATQINGYSSPYWLTFRQALAQGGNVKKGEKGWPCIFFKTLDKDDAAETGDTQDETKDGEDTRRSRAIARYFTVFNLDQCEGITAPALPDVAPFNPIEACEAIVTGFETRGPAVHFGGNQACYIPSSDSVETPSPQQFASPEDFYSTLFHEFGHGTGHPTRLARFETTAAVAAFGSESYSREELVAEMTAAFLCAEAGISPPTLDQQAAYIKGWLSRLRDDSRAVVTAAAQAQKASDFILGINGHNPQPVNAQVDVQ
jgi:antirestriction protein ArdC